MALKTINRELIKQKRIEKGYSMQDMAEKLGYKTATSYMRYERGDYRIDEDMLPKLSVILGISISKFFN